MREFALIAAIRRMLGPAAPPVLVGAGDDGAVLEGSRRPEVVTTDTQIDGVHFRLEWLSPRGAAARAVAVTLSDLAAMGARPRALFAALSLPRSFPSRSALSLVRGMAAAAGRVSCPLAGGNVAVYDGPLAMTLTALGTIPAGRSALVRSSARPGEIVYSTGLPGLARIGLEALARGAANTAILKRAVRQFLRPHACFEELEFLAARVRLGAVIDISDGLAGDLGHVLAESGVGAELDPVCPAAYRTACASLGLDPLACLLGPSDDYELLATSADPRMERVRAAFRQRFRRDLVCLGRITKRRGLRMRSAEGTVRRVRASSYEHGTAGPKGQSCELRMSRS